MFLMPLSVSASMTRCQPSVRFRSASAALASAVAAAVSSMVPSGAVAFWRSEGVPYFGIPLKVNMMPRRLFFVGAALEPADRSRIRARDRKRGRRLSYVILTSQHGTAFACVPSPDCEVDYAIDRLC